MLPLLDAIQLAWRFRRYQPQPVSVRFASAYLEQFSAEERKVALKLLRHINYVPKKTFEDELVALHARLVEYLVEAGFSRDEIIYVAYDSAGSSSGVVLNMIRNRAQLEKHNSVLLDGKDTKALVDITTQRKQGAIVYVDDFLGSGGQFSASHVDISASIMNPGLFSQFLLVHTACQEAVGAVASRPSVQLVACHIHGTAQRPLHTFSSHLTRDERVHAMRMCDATRADRPLGWNSLASMVVFEHGIPDNAPRLFRGSEDQIPRRGLLPRPDDLPARTG